MIPEKHPVSTAPQADIDLAHAVAAGDQDAFTTLMRRHNKRHAELLAATIGKLGGRAVDAREKYGFPVDTLKNQTDVLRFAAALEKGAVSAYLGAIPLFGNRDLAKAAGSILGDEAMHWAILRNAVGDVPVPDAFVA